MNNEKLYTMFVTNCCDDFVEVEIDEKFLREEEWELVCPTCGKKDVQK